MKDKIYRTNPHPEEELKENIRREILEVPQEELLRVNFNLFKRYRERVHAQGHYFQHLVRSLCCLFGAILDSDRESLVALGGKSCSSCRELGSESCV
jgi:hypothetical protein